MPSQLDLPLPGVRMSIGKKEKRCVFLCGCIFGVTPDPVQERRTAVRWAYELAAENSEPNDQGLCDHWCDRSFEEYAPSLPVSTVRSDFLAEIAGDNDKLKAFLNHRAKVIQKAKSKAAGKVEKRSGGHSTANLTRPALAGTGCQFAKSAWTSFEFSGQSAGSKVCVLVGGLCDSFCRCPGPVTFAGRVVKSRLLPPWLIYIGSGALALEFWGGSSGITCELVRHPVEALRSQSWAGGRSGSGERRLAGRAGGRGAVF
jgi:hypothetical protein